MYPVVDHLTLYFTTHVKDTPHPMQTVNLQRFLGVRPIDKHPDNLRRRYHFLVVFQIMDRHRKLFENWYRDLSANHIEVKGKTKKPIKRT